MKEKCGDRILRLQAVQQTCCRDHRCLFIITVLSHASLTTTWELQMHYWGLVLSFIQRNKAVKAGISSCSGLNEDTQLNFYCLTLFCSYILLLKSILPFVSAIHSTFIQGSQLKSLLQRISNDLKMNTFVNRKLREQKVRWTIIVVDIMSMTKTCCPSFSVFPLVCVNWLIQTNFIRSIVPTPLHCKDVVLMSTETTWCHFTTPFTGDTIHFPLDQ